MTPRPSSPPSPFTDYGAGNFGATAQGMNPLTLDHSVRWLNLYNNGAAGGSINVTLQPVGVAGPLTTPVTMKIAAGQGLSIQTTPFATIAAGSASASLFYFYSDERVFSSQAAPSSTTVILPSPALVETADSGNNVRFATFANGGAAPCNGTVNCLIKATSADAITLSDGTNSFQLTASATGQWQAFSFPVVQGVDYTLGATGLAILGTLLVVV